MLTVAEQALVQALSPGVTLTTIEPHIHSAVAGDSVLNAYDTEFGNIYEWVACNPIYNRLIWGYSIKKYGCFTNEALSTSGHGCVLDLACGSLAFTAKTYVQKHHPPVILSDQSLKMLKMAKSRIVRLHGKVPENLVFVHADATELPFRCDSFNTIICLNLIHCLPDIRAFLAGLMSVATCTAKLYFTTLILSHRLSDRYLLALSNAGKIVPRNINQLCTAFQEAYIQMTYEVSGNLAFLRTRGSANQAMEPTVATVAI